MTISQSSRNLGDLFHRVCDRYNQKVGAMYRDGKDFHSLSFAEIHERVRIFASALDSLGLKKGDTLAILAESSIDWAHTDWAAQTLGIITVPIYPTLMPDQIEYILKDSGTKTVAVGSKELASKVRDLPIYGIRSNEGLESLQDVAPNALLDFQEWRQISETIDREDVATIIYTSGTTGDPKGAVLPHRCFLSLTDGIQQSLPIDEKDTFLSFLPLSHVFERFAGHVLPLSVGAIVAYSGGLMTLTKDMVAVRPTVMLLVPRLLEAIRDRILDGVKKESKFKQWLFSRALAAGLKRQQGGHPFLGGLLDRLVGAKIREKTGGRIRFFVSGAAPLSPSVSEFYIAFGLNVLQGYGLTETMAATAVNHPDRNDPKTVGEPIMGMEVAIASDGEILIRGPGVMKGYLNLPQPTAEAIDQEGWFHSGDIGEFEGMKLKITDRKKDLLILANGKNVAPQPIENKLKFSEYIAEAVLFGDQMESVCALIVPNFERLKSFAKDHDLISKDDEELISLPEIKKLLKDEITEVNKSLADFEKVKRYEVLSQQFSEATGELTPTLKVKRKVVRTKYAEVIARMERS